MIIYRSYQFGSVFGMLYDFGAAGDRLPTHNHQTYGDEHNVICLSGHVMIEIGEQKILVDEGVWAEFDGMLDHTVIAMFPSRTLHLYKNGRPESFIDGFIGTYGT